MNALDRLIADIQTAHARTTRTDLPPACPKGQPPRARKARRTAEVPAIAVPPRLTLPEPPALDWDQQQAIKRLQAQLKRRQNAPQPYRFPFAIGPRSGQPKTVAEYVAEFCGLNSLIHEGAAP